MDNPSKPLPKKNPPTAYTESPEKLNVIAGVGDAVESHLSASEPTEYTLPRDAVADTEIPPTLKLYGVVTGVTGSGRDSNVSVPNEVTTAKNDAGSV